MNKKKILIFSLAYEPFIGGAEVALKEITNRIGDDFSFDIITLRFDSALPRYEHIGNTDVYRVGFSKKTPTADEMIGFPLYLTKIFYPLSAFLKAVILHHRNHYDALWAMMAYAGFPVVFFRLLYPKIPYILTLQEGDPISYMVDRWRIRAVFLILKRVFMRASAVSAISTYLGEYARLMGFNGLIKIIPNGVSIKDFTEDFSKEKIISLRKSIGLNKDDICLITTSRLVPKNAVDDVIKSLKYIPARVKFLIIGDGPGREALKSQVESCKLQERVFFLGHVAHKELPLYYKIADIFVRPSISEGMGISFVEAMAAGLPVIGTAVGGITDFLRDRETGFICEVKNPESIAEQVNYIITPQNKNKVHDIVKNAAELTEKNYDWDKISRAMKDLFENFI